MNGCNKCEIKPWCGEHGDGGTCYCCHPCEAHDADRLRAENEVLRKDNLSLVNDLEQEGSRIEDMAREIAKLREALEKIARAFESGRAFADTTGEGVAIIRNLLRGS